MDSLEESIAKSLDGSEQIELYNFLPYLLQDLWEMGGSAQTIITLLKRNKINPAALQVLDLGCGKGAVAIRLAQEFGFNVTGVDGLDAFISEAWKKAVELKVDHICKFECDDIRNYVKEKHAFDIVLMTAVGSVLGKVDEILKAIENQLSPGGYFIWDDGFIPEGSDYKREEYPDELEVFNSISLSGFEVIDIEYSGKESLEETDNDIFNLIKERAEELEEKFPDKKEIFRGYIKKQEAENEIIENLIKNFCMILKKKS